MRNFFALSGKNAFSPDESGIVKVLDIGCGPGTYVPYLLDTDYTGIDMNKENILLAKKKYLNFSNIKFIAEDVNKYFLNNLVQESTFDVIFMSGVLHHLSEDMKKPILSLVPKLLKKETGEFRAFDPVYTKELPKISKWLMSHDRGKYTLELDDYLEFIKKYFPVLEYRVESGWSRFPFPYPVIYCQGYLQ